MNDIINELTSLYKKDDRDWFMGFSGGKDSTLLASLIFRAILQIPKNERTKEVNVIFTDTGVEIPAYIEVAKKNVNSMIAFAKKNRLNINVNVLKPELRDSFWVTLIGRGYSPPSRNFRWCTQRLKINTAHRFIKNKLNKNDSAIMFIGTRRSESASRARIMDSYKAKRDNNSQIFTYPPIENLTTEQVWDYLLNNNTPWGFDIRELYNLYLAAGGKNARFGCWTCTVVNRDKTSEGLANNGDERIKLLLDYRQKMIEYGKPKNGYRIVEIVDNKEKIGRFKLTTRQDLLNELLILQNKINYNLITQDEIEMIYDMWRKGQS